MTIHPACMALPGLPAKAFADLCDSIKAIGLQQPILVDGDHRVLDGKNRLWAANEVGVAPRFQKVEVAGDPVQWVFELNRHRLRKNGQLALAAARLATAEGGRPRKTSPIEEVSSYTLERVSELMGVSKTVIGRAKFVLSERFSSSKEEVVGYTRDRVSALMGVSKSTIDRAKFVLAEKRAVDELIEYLERGEITLGCAEWASQGHHKEQTEACADSAKAVRALATLVRARKESSKTAKKRKAADFDDGLREALEWVNRWGRYGPFAEICDAVVAVAERSRKIGGINEASAQA